MGLKVLVIADDLTGANDTGALLSKHGFHAVSSPTMKVHPSLLSGREALSINADSRAMGREEAYACVRGLTEQFAGEGAALLSKRIDTTLRGNVGAEIDAVLDGLETPHKAVVVSAFPRAGRTCVGGYVLVGGVALERTDAANDPRWPVRESCILDIIARQSSRSARLFPLKAVYRGARPLAEEIRLAAEQVLVFDALTDGDVKIIAEACVLSGIPFICVDPGCFTLHAARAKFSALTAPARMERALLVVGSRMVQTREQLDYLLEAMDPLMYRVDAHRLLDNFEAECDAAMAALEAGADKHRVLCLTTAYAAELKDAPKVPLVSKGLQKLAERVLCRREWNITLCYLSGGDVARDFMEGACAQGIDLTDEVLPLAVYGKLIGGKHGGLRILTKGGMIGARDAIAVMLAMAGFQ